MGYNDILKKTAVRREKLLLRVALNVRGFRRVHNENQDVLRTDRHLHKG